MNKIAKLTLSVVALMPLSSLAASTVETVSVEPAKLANDRVMPPQDTQKTYSFDEEAVKKNAEAQSSLLKVNCDGVQILKDLGFAQSSSNIFYLGVSQESFDYNFDLRNCSLWASKTNQQYTGKPVTEAQAIAAAKSYMGSKYLTQKIFSQYGAPIVMAKNNGGGYPVFREAMNSDKVKALGGDIEIDSTDTGEDIKPQYVSFSILFPYLINGKPVYNNYGNRAGITVEVTSEGVVSMNAQLLPFKGAVRNSDKMSASDMISYIKKGGNNQYRGQESKVELGKPESILVLFSLRRNNMNEMYLSSGIKFSTQLKPDQYTQQPYEMTLSDYKIGNNNYGY